VANAGWVVVVEADYLEAPCLEAGVSSKSCPKVAYSYNSDAALPLQPQDAPQVFAQA
jgi:hypothetical protein